ncbi:MAG TPA: fumarylacetoacetate hydrolase family protein [Pseudolabrys sp.]|nr:fumarylacetoacetate hydrolase family protein [Pseudolabrys sp.]
MRLVTFSDGQNGEKIGVLAGDNGIIDIGRAAQALGIALPFRADDMIDLIATGRPGADAIAAILARKPAPHHTLSDVTLRAPIPRPRKNIFCVGWNYLEHFEEGAKTRTNVTELPAFPTFFTKTPTCANAPYGDITTHDGLTDKLDWEAELALVIGRKGKNIAEADAMDHVFGYMVANDVTAREIQRRHGQQWFKGKSLDGYCPMGPWITTRDEVPDAESLSIACSVNGATKQSSNTRHLYFKIPRIIAELSAGLTLEPGDIVLTGTPHGVGHARTPPEFMAVGDVLETEIMGLGRLRNAVRA